MLNPSIWRKHFENVLKKTICMGKQTGGFYAVKKGRCPGIYFTWAECESQVKGFSNARYKKFSTEKEAISFIEDCPVRNVPGTVSQLAEIKNLTQSLENTNFSVDQTLSTPQSSNTNSPKRTVKKISVKECKRKLDCIAEEESKETTMELSTQRKKQKLESSGSKEKEVLVYTDGACCSNGREGAKAGIGVYWGPNHPLNVSERLPGRQTNNRAEIHAAVRALQQAKEIGANNVTVYTDSNFLIKAITKWIFGWKKNGWKLSTGERVKNKDDFEVLERAKKGLKVNWVHVRGHKGIHGNEEADRLAVQSLEKSL